MKAVVTTKPEPKSLQLKDIPVPEPKPGEVLVKLKIASICGTDVHIYKWDAWAQKRIKTPLVQGHEWAGEVAALGAGVKGLAIGDYVSGEGHIPDWTCNTCRGGNPHICRNVSILGIDRQGSFAEYMPVPAANIVKNPPDLPLEFATIQDPLGNAVQTAWSANPAGKVVAVTGLGPIGLMSITVAQALGAAKVIAIGHKNQFRIDLARKVGADLVLGAKDDITGRIHDFTGGEGVDEVLEMSGASDAVDLGLKVLKPGGGLHLLGVFPDKFTVDVNELVFKGKRMVGIHGRRMFQDWQLMQGLLRQGRLNLEPIITHRLRLTEFDKAFEAMLGDSGKVVMRVA
jgi:threonine 3-dehydrogenase